ncbi:MAG: DUF1543 domain-containing protein [Sphingobacteriaceae bacterium]
MVLLGANPRGRIVEQHDYFFGIAANLKDLVPAIRDFWPEGGKTIHIDGWREVNAVDGYNILVELKNESKALSKKKLFFINLGGYQSGKLEEQHYTMLTIQDDRLPAVKESMKSHFYKAINIKGGYAHIDEKYGVDVDDVYRIEDVLSADLKENYQLLITPVEGLAEDSINLGYFKLDKL